MRIQVTISEQTGNELNRRADAWGMDRSVLIEHVLRTWILREHSITLTLAAPSRASVGPASRESGLSGAAVVGARTLSRPQYGDETTRAPPEDDDEDTQQCSDCAEVVPMSHYTPGMEHKNCTMPGAGIVALRRLATEQPPE
jgi:hypothetical protein